MSFLHMGSPESSAGKESSCNAGDPSLIPGWGRSPGEGIGYPPQYFWASLVVQLVKNLPAMQETWVRSLGWEDPLEKGKASHSSILAWRIPWTMWSMGSQRVRHNWVTFTSLPNMRLYDCDRIISFIILQYFQGALMLQHVSVLHSFLRLNNIPLCEYTTFRLSIHQVRDFLAVLIYGLLWTVLLWTSCICLYADMSLHFS